MIYLDSAGSYPILPEIRNKLGQYFINNANPSASHMMGMDQMTMIDSVRELISDSIDAYGSEIIFTSGATESNNIALKSHFADQSNGRHFIVSSIEHKCILAITQYLVDHMGVDVSVVKPDVNGVITVDAIEQLVRPETSLVSVMHVNNELGSVNPIAQIGKFCFGRGIKLHSDCAQSYMKQEIDVNTLNVDYLSISAHKIGGFKGVGAVYIRDRKHMTIEPVIHGAGQEDGLRGGTLPAPLIEAFGDAIDLFPKYRDIVVNNNFGKMLIDELTNRSISFQINGVSSEFILSLTLPDVDVRSFITRYQDKVALATTSACNSGELQPSHVLTGIGLDRTCAEHTMRLSFHHELLQENIVELADMIDTF